GTILIFLDKNKEQAEKLAKEVGVTEIYESDNLEELYREIKERIERENPNATILTVTDPNELKKIQDEGKVDRIILLIKGSLEHHHHHH
uniref:NF8 n=1 Tax=synthetic construct TaxID=32630 RepID=UPI001AA00D1D|nr:Chain A, NF8 [synthetic construct]